MNFASDPGCQSIVVTRCEGRLNLRNGSGSVSDAACCLFARRCGRMRCLRTCRWPPTPAVPAFCLLRTAQLLRRSRTPYQEPFPFSPVSFPPDDEGKYIEDLTNHLRNPHIARAVIHRDSQPSTCARLAWCKTRWIVWQTWIICAVFCSTREFFLAIMRIPF